MRDTPIEESKQRKSKKPQPTENAMDLGSYLFESIAKNHPGYFGKTFDKPAARMRKLLTWARFIDSHILDKDGRDILEVCDIAQFSQTNKFWKKIIVSPQSLSKHYKRLKDQHQYAVAVEALLEDKNPEVTAEIVKLYEKTFCGRNRNINWHAFDMQHFIKAAARAVDLCGSTNLVLKGIPKILIEMLKFRRRETGKTIEPKELSSDHTWQVLLPQYLLEIGISVRAKKEQQK